MRYLMLVTIVALSACGMEGDPEDVQQETLEGYGLTIQSDEDGDAPATIVTRWQFFRGDETTQTQTRIRFNTMFHWVCLQDQRPNPEATAAVCAQAAEEGIYDPELGSCPIEVQDTVSIPGGNWDRCPTTVGDRMVCRHGMSQANFDPEFPEYRRREREAILGVFNVARQRFQRVVYCVFIPQAEVAGIEATRYPVQVPDVEMSWEDGRGNPFFEQSLGAWQLLRAERSVR